MTSGNGMIRDETTSIVCGGDSGEKDVIKSVKLTSGPGKSESNVNEYVSSGCFNGTATRIMFAVVVKWVGMSRCLWKWIRVGRNLDYIIWKSDFVIPLPSFPNTPIIPSSNTTTMRRHIPSPTPLLTDASPSPSSQPRIFEHKFPAPLLSPSLSNFPGPGNPSPLMEQFGMVRKAFLRIFL